MKFKQAKIISALSLSLMLASGPALGQRAGQSIRISTGIVENVQSVTLESQAGTGALVGGTLGLLSASNKSNSRRVRNTIIGAGTGGAVTSIAQGSRSGQAFTITTTDGNSIRVISDQSGIIRGDCVTVEETGSTTNIRRVAATACDAASARAREELRGTFQMEASACHNAKQALVDATTIDQLDLAQRRMEILCND